MKYLLMNIHNSDIVGFAYSYQGGDIMGGMAPDSFYNSQLFAFLFAFIVFLAGVVLMVIVCQPAVKRIEELDSENRD